MKRIAAVGIALALAAFMQVSASADTGSLQLPTDDHGMFLNILPAGEGTSTTTPDAVQYEAGGGPPAHDVDQEKMYESLPLQQHLTDADLGRYFKSESFLPPTQAQTESTESPTAPGYPSGLTIVQDSYGVPHIYGDTRSEAMFGAGYASAQDRLFEMDVLRHVGEGHLSEFLGASPANLQMDEATWQIAGYWTGNLQDMIFQRLSSTPQGQQVIQDVKDYVAGINARINEDINQRPDEMPAEYPALQIQPQSWVPSDVVAVALLIQAEFAGGGGSELQNAMFLRDAQQFMGKTKGRNLLRDMMQSNDPSAPVTADGRFPYMATGKVDPAAVALPDPGSVQQFQTITTSSGSNGNAPNFEGQSPLQLLRNGLTRLGLMVPNGASNWLAVTKRYSASHHPIAVMGPQVGYWSPEILMEMDIHAPGLDARGATFPGISLYVLLGRGPDFAWSATSGESDLIDIRAEQLCSTDGKPPTTSSTSYVYKGQCTPMYTYSENWFAKPSAGGQGPPEQVTAHVERSIHGPVFATGTIHGNPVAFTIERSTFGAELDAAIPFLYLNGCSACGPSGQQFDAHVTDPASFITAMGYMTGSFNWLYVDDQHVAYFHSGLYPIRAPGVDPALPSWGTGQWDWQGFTAGSDAMGANFATVANTAHPQEVDPSKGWIASWNNKPARGWHAADSQWSYGPVHRVQMLSAQLARRIPKGNVTPATMVQIMANAATIDLRGQEDLPWLLRLIGTDQKDATILRILRGWQAAGWHRIDRNGDGRYEHHDAVAFMDAWWPRLVHRMFNRELDELYGDAVVGIDNHPGPDGSAYQDGYYGYVQKAVQMALGLHVADPYLVLRCGKGTLAGCRRAVIGSLRATEKALGSDTSKWNAHEQRDQIQYSGVGLVDAPNMPWQNRPTFQQVVEVTSHS